MNKISINTIVNNPKFIRVMIIIGITAIALIFISSYINIGDSSEDDIDAHCQQIKSQLHSVITKIDGVGRAEIFLTMDNSGENVYLENSDTKTKSISPVVRGVVIVCDGGDDSVIVSRVMSAVTKSLDIPTSKVCVTKLKN